MGRNWTVDGVQEAIKIILDENSTLFDDLTKKIEDNTDLKNLFYNLTIDNQIINYNAHDPVIKTGLMYCFLAKNDSKLVIHNKIFEIVITNYFVSRNRTTPQFRNVKPASQNEIIRDNFFDMELCLNRFKYHYAELYTDKDFHFLEHSGKLIFLTYIMPLINGTGFYHYESETRDNGKMDLVINYLKQQFILEVKLWYGESRHEDAYKQLAGYLQSKNMDCGYLLTFDFRKQGDDSYAENQWITYDDKRIFNVVLRHPITEKTKKFVIA